MSETPNIIVPIDTYVAMSNELDMLRADNAALREYIGDGPLRIASRFSEMRDEITRLREEVVHLRIYAPGQHQAHVVKPIPRIGPTNWAFYGLPDETEAQCS